MFRTDLNHYLQAFDWPGLHKMMLYVSILGTVYMISLVVLVLIGSVNFRKGFLVLNLLGWGVLIMLAGKNYVDYPRPIAVDSSLESFNEEKTLIELSAMQPRGFFERFSPALLAKTRASDIGRYGFPSGHVLIITVIWIGIALLFSKRWLWAISILLIVLTMVSRMYLGLHYFGDVIGGLIIGVMLSLGFNILFDKLRLRDGIRLNPWHITFFLFPLVLLLFYNIVPGFQAGMLIGFNIALLLILKLWGEPILADSLVKRVLNVLLFILLYFSAYYLTKRLPLDKTGMLAIGIFTIVNFTVVILFLFVGKKLRFYKAFLNE